MPSSACRLLLSLLICAAVSSEVHAVPQDRGVRASGPAVTGPIEGSLVIGGGGGMTDEVWAKFIELAGGEDSKIVVVPTAGASADDNDPTQTVAQWKERGAAHVDVLHTRSREVAQSAEFVAPLISATGVWFGGGSQTRMFLS